MFRSRKLSPQVVYSNCLLSFTILTFSSALVLSSACQTLSPETLQISRQKFENAKPSTQARQITSFEAYLSQAAKMARQSDPANNNKAQTASGRAIRQLFKGTTSSEARSGNGAGYGSAGYGYQNQAYGTNSQYGGTNTYGQALDYNQITPNYYQTPGYKQVPSHKKPTPYHKSPKSARPLKVKVLELTKPEIKLIKMPATKFVRFGSPLALSKLNFRQLFDFSGVKTHLEPINYKAIEPLVFIKDGVKTGKKPEIGDPEDDKKPEDPLKKNVEEKVEEKLEKIEEPVDVLKEQVVEKLEKIVEPVDALKEQVVEKLEKIVEPVDALKEKVGEKLEKLEKPVEALKEKFEEELVKPASALKKIVEDKLEKGKKPEKLEDPGEPKEGERAGKPGNSEKPEKLESAAKVGTSNKSENSGKPEDPKEGERVGKPGDSERPEEPENVEKADKPEGSERPGKPGDPKEGERAGTPEKAEKPEKADEGKEKGQERTGKILPEGNLGGPKVGGTSKITEQPAQVKKTLDPSAPLNKLEDAEDKLVAKKVAEKLKDVLAKLSIDEKVKSLKEKLSLGLDPEVGLSKLVQEVKDGFMIEAGVTGELPHDEDLVLDLQMKAGADEPNHAWANAQPATLGAGVDSKLAVEAPESTRTEQVAEPVAPLEAAIEAGFMIPGEIKEITWSKVVDWLKKATDIKHIEANPKKFLEEWDRIIKWIQNKYPELSPIIEEINVKGVPDKIKWLQDLSWSKRVEWLRDGVVLKPLKKVVAALAAAVKNKDGDGNISGERANTPPSGVKQFQDAAKPLMNFGGDLSEMMLRGPNETVKDNDDEVNSPMVILPSKPKFNDVK